MSSRKRGSDLLKNVHHSKITKYFQLVPNSQIISESVPSSLSVPDNRSNISDNQTGMCIFSVFIDIYSCSRFVIGNGWTKTWSTKLGRCICGCRNFEIRFESCRCSFSFKNVQFLDRFHKLKPRWTPEMRQSLLQLFIFIIKSDFDFSPQQSHVNEFIRNVDKEMEARIKRTAEYIYKQAKKFTMNLRLDNLVFYQFLIRKLTK